MAPPLPLAWAKVKNLIVVLSIYKTTISIDWYIWNNFLSRQGILSVVGELGIDLLFTPEKRKPNQIRNLRQFLTCPSLDLV